MSNMLAQASCASLPAGELARLGLLRARTDVRVLLADDRLWVFWPAGDVELARMLLALPGVALFEQEGALFRPLGCRLPVFGIPDPANARSLPALLSPAQFLADEPAPGGWTRAGLRLASDDRPRAATALRLPLVRLMPWSETATSHQLAGLRGACCEGDVVLCGQLPPLLGERFWGERVLFPAGWRPEPALAEGILAQALDLAPGEVALVTAQGADVIPEGAFGPVTRAGLRMAGEIAHHAR
jgi:hypothetical protein